MSNVILRLSVAVILILVSARVTTQAETRVKQQVDSLFVIASSGEIKYQDLRDPAMDQIAAFGVEAVPILIDKFTTKSARERWTIIWIFQRIGSPAVPDLLAALKRSDGQVVQRVCWALGDIKDSSAVDGLISVCGHQRWQVRDQAIDALGKIGHQKATQAAMEALQDTIGQVRKSAVVTIGQLAVNEAVEELAHALGDEFYGARLMAVNSLLQLDTALVLQTLADSLNSENRLAGNLACLVLGRIGSDEALALLLDQTKSTDPDRRSHAAVALAQSDPYDNCRFRNQYYDSETDRLVRLKIESILNAVENDE